MSRLFPLTMRRILLLGLALGLLVMPVACHNEMDFNTGSQGDPSCQLLNSTLDFGTLTADGSFVDRSFSIRNIGGGQLVGTVRVETPGVTIVSGGGFYTLGQGQFRKVTVRFRPDAAGDYSGEVLAGNLCHAAVFTGHAIASVVCQVSPLDLNFGTVQTGGPAVDKTFTITNPGTTPLTGRVTASCDAFTIVSGSGDYTLGAGQSRTVTVRFQPGTAGNQDCLIETGASACGDVSAVGLAENPPLCDVSPTRFDFGTVNVGFSASTDFTITNTGGGTLSGNATASCSGFTIVSGGGAYSLDAGQSRTVSVRYQPTAPGVDSCTIDLGAGSGCAGPVFTGRGDRLPVCSLSTATLDFGTVAPGSSRDLDFTVRNDGGGTLSGAIAASCAGFSITAGAGSFALTAGASRQVTVRFEPSHSGPFSCTIGTGIESCPSVSASGTGEAGAVCDVTPAAITFSPVVVGSSADTTFTLRNSGGGTLSGTISENCADFSITAGGGSYSLASGQERTVSVRFQPASGGTKSCTIDLGNAVCTGITVSGSGDLPPQCNVSPNTLAFGGVAIGSSSEKDFTITNGGGGILTGNVSASCPGYTIVAGDGSFSLGSGQSRIVTLHFEPLTIGTLNCTLSLGTACGTLTATGSGLASSCVITPSSLSFGTIQVGTTATRTFVIKNNGATSISGNVALGACDAFSITSGAGPFTLNTNDQKSVIVVFSPTIVGIQTCTIETGTAACSDVNATGTAEPPPSCEITPGSVDFGTVVVGVTSAPQSFTIRNSGGGTLTGSVSENCPAFAITGGNGSFSLAAGTSRTVTATFTPTAAGPQNCTVSTGTNCPGVNLTGTGEPAPVCAISPTSLAFGTVAVGAFLDKSFTITNNGGSTLTGNVSAACGEFSITSGAGAFNLTNGQTRSVTVRFQPQTGGPKSCTIETGVALCSDVTATGTGDAPPACSLSPTSLNFGNVIVGSQADRSFTITNSGGQTLTGNVSASCSEFSIKSGGGAFSLTAGQIRTVTVTFAPTSAGSGKTCTITTGACADVPASGTGVPPPACQLSTTSLDFGLVTADGNTSFDRQFTITNSGGGTLSGSVSLSCPNYLIASGSGAFSLNASQSKTITIRFQPASGAFGTFNCTIQTGTTACGTVSATGIGAVGFVAHVQPLITGSCAVVNCHNGSNNLPDFRIYANATSPTYVNTTTPTSSLLLLKPANQPNPDGLHGGGLIPGWSIGSANYNTTLLWIQQGLRP